MASMREPSAPPISHPSRQMRPSTGLETEAQPREVHTQGAGALILPAPDDGFGGLAKQLSADRIDTVIGGCLADLLTDMKAERRTAILFRQRRRPGGPGDANRLRAIERAVCAVAETEHTLQPGRDGRIGIDQRCG